MAASAIDHAIIFLTTLSLCLLSIVIIGQDILSLDLVGILPPLVLFLFLTNALYFTFFHGLGASTLGETTFGLILIGSDGTPLTFSRALLHWAASLVSAVSFGLGLLWGWHDKIAKTYMAKKM